MTNQNRRFATTFYLLCISFVFACVLLGCSSVPSLLPVQPPITPTVHVPQVYNGFMAFNAIEKFGEKGRGYRMNPDGSSLQPFSHDGYDIVSIWSPDGQHMLFQSEKSPDCLFVINADGTEETCFPVGEAWSQVADAAVIQSLVWSPDGTKIAFSMQAYYSSTIYVINADGSDLHTVSPPTLWAFWPAWSPDSTHLVFANTSESLGSIGRNLYIVAADGTGLQQLKDDGEHDIYPDWMPSGKDIVYLSERGTVYGVSRSLYVYNLDDQTNTRLLTSLDADNESFWDVSPDGTKLLVSAWIRSTKSWSLLVLDADDYSLLYSLPVSLSGDVKGMWSPDGQQILYMDGSLRHHIMNADGTNDFELILPFEYVERIAWQPVWK